MSSAKVFRRPCCYAWNLGTSSPLLVGSGRSGGAETGRGSGGALRSICFWDARGTIYMLLPYRKSRQEDLTPSRAKALAALVKEYLAWTTPTSRS